MEWLKDTLQSYQAKGFAARSGFGRRPALLIVDYMKGFTDPTSPLGGDFSSQLVATEALIAAFRQAVFPVIYTTIEYDDDFNDAGVFIKKVPSLAILRRGSPMCEVDDQIKPQANDYIVSKKYASSFFGTNLDTYLRNQGADTLVIVGCTTSGCVRASAVDSLQYGYHTIVVREGCGDRAEGPHEANLFDMDAKYADVVSLDECLESVRQVDSSSRSVGSKAAAS
ncbi:MAG: isochorismatase family protein [Burkholderiaceae bacterium]